MSDDVFQPLKNESRHLATLIQRINEQIASELAIPSHILTGHYRKLASQGRSGDYAHGASPLATTTYEAMSSRARRKHLRTMHDYDLVRHLNAQLKLKLEWLAAIKTPPPHGTPKATHAHSLKLINEQLAWLHQDLLLIHDELTCRMPVYFTPTSDYVYLDNQRVKLSSVPAPVLETILVDLERLLIASDHDALTVAFPNEAERRLVLWRKKQRRIEQELAQRRPCSHPEDTWPPIYFTAAGDILAPDQPLPHDHFKVCTRCAQRV